METPVEEIKIPHAYKTMVVPSPPRNIFHVWTRLPRLPISEHAAERYELRKAVALEVGDRGGLDAQVIHWSDD
jgi:hypothetical protein